MARRSKSPTRLDVIAALDETAITLLAYVQSLSSRDVTRLVGVIPALADVRERFERATVPEDPDGSS